MPTKHFCSGLAVVSRMGGGAVLRGALALAAVTGLAQGFPKPPPPPPPSNVVNAVQGAVNQGAGAVTNLTAEQKQKLEEAKRQIKAQIKAAGEAVRIQVAQRVTQLNTFYRDQRKTRQASQKAMLARNLTAKKAPMAAALKASPAKTTAAPGGARGKPLSGGSDSLTAPAISNLSATSGEPGDTILVTGTGFTQTTEVYFLVAPNRQEKGILGFSNDTQLMVEVPLVTGVVPFSGLVLVKREDGQVSQGSPFRFMPRTVVVGYLFGDNEVITDAVLHNDGGANKEILGHNYGYESNISVEHSLWSPYGFKVDDILFPNTRLKNGWVVEDVVFRGNWFTGQGQAELIEFGKGTNALKMKVHGWTIVPFLGVVCSVGYFAQPLVRGPEGLNYK